MSSQTSDVWLLEMLFKKTGFVDFSLSMKNKKERRVSMDLLCPDQSKRGKEINEYAVGRQNEMKNMKKEKQENTFSLFFIESFIAAIELDPFRANRYGYCLYSFIMTKFYRNQDAIE